MASIENVLEGRLEQRQREYRRTSADNQARIAQFKRSIIKGTLVVLGVALVIAIVAEILSIFALGWIVSWAVAGLCTIVGRRIVKTQKTSELLSQAAQDEVRRFDMLARRVRPLFSKTPYQKLLSAGDIQAIPYAHRSYWVRLIRDQVAAQLIELIPAIDAILPMYIASVVKVGFDERKEHRQAMGLLATYQHITGRIERILEVEIALLAQQLEYLGQPRAQIEQLQPVAQVARPVRNDVRDIAPQEPIPFRRKSIPSKPIPMNDIALPLAA